MEQRFLQIQSECREQFSGESKSLRLFGGPRPRRGNAYGPWQRRQLYWHTLCKITYTILLALIVAGAIRSTFGAPPNTLPSTGVSNPDVENPSVSVYVTEMTWDGARNSRFPT